MLHGVEQHFLFRIKRALFDILDALVAAEAKVVHIARQKELCDVGVAREVFRKLPADVPCAPFVILTVDYRNIHRFHL